MTARIADFRRSNFRRLALAAGVAALGLTSLSAPGRAESLDDGKGSLGDMFKTMAGVGLGLSTGDDGPDIDYRDRAPLVLPKDRSQLPAPAQRQRPAAWPNDPDAAARRKARLGEPIRSESDKGPALTAHDLRNNRASGVPAGQTPVESQCRSFGSGDCVWMDPNKLRTTGVLKDAAKTPIGSEPERNWLVEPPKGYRKVTQQAGVGKTAARPDDDAEASPYSFFKNPFKKDDDE
jgi:hypothetical protein